MSNYSVDHGVGAGGIGSRSRILTCNPVCIGSDRIRRAVGSPAVNIRRSVNIRLNCIRLVLAERYNFANIDLLERQIGHSFHCHGVRNSYSADAVRAGRHCDNYYYSLAVAPAHGLEDRVWAGLACAVDIFVLDAAALDRIGRASVRAVQLVDHVSSEL